MSKPLLDDARVTHFTNPKTGEAACASRNGILYDLFHLPSTVKCGCGNCKRTHSFKEAQAKESVQEVADASQN